MIRRLRSRHRWMTPLMGALALAGLGAAVASRPAPTIMATVPDALEPPMPPSAAADRPLRAGDDLWRGTRLATTIYPTRIQLSTRYPLRRPASLVYWSPTTASPGDTLPDGAVLLGALAGGPQAQSFSHPGSDGTLLLFSLAHGEVFASLALAAKETP